MGIVNAGMSASTTSSSRSCASASRTWCSTAAPDATERLIEIAGSSRRAPRRTSKDEAWRTGRCRSASSHALVHGITTYIVADTEEARGSSYRGGRSR